MAPALEFCTRSIDICTGARADINSTQLQPRGPAREMGVGALGGAKQQRFVAALARRAQHGAAGQARAAFGSAGNARGRMRARAAELTLTADLEMQTALTPYIFVR